MDKNNVIQISLVYLKAKGVSLTATPPDSVDWYLVVNKMFLFTTLMILTLLFHANGFRLKLLQVNIGVDSR